jgi:hypothetical protein
MVAGGLLGAKQSMLCGTLTEDDGLCHLVIVSNDQLLQLNASCAQRPTSSYKPTWLEQEVVYKTAKYNVNVFYGCLNRITNQTTSRLDQKGDDEW